MKFRRSFFRSFLTVLSLIALDPLSLPAGDCNRNGVEDLTDIANGTSEDCDGNRWPDECDRAEGRGADFNGNGIDDQCERDCDGDGIDDADEIAAGSVPDCNANGMPDPCELAQGLAFKVAEILPGIRSPAAMAPADLDGDRDLDLVVAIREILSIYRNLGDRRFVRTESLPVGFTAAHIGAGDLDGDLDTDLVTVNSAGANEFPDSLSVILNDGRGSLRVARNYAIGKSPAGLVVRDLDGDGLPDVAVAIRGSNRQGPRNLELFINRGGADFTPATTIPFYEIPQSLAWFDMEGDGDADLLIPFSTPFSNRRQLTVLRNDGSSGFEIAFTENDILVSQVATGDVDGDGDLDLLASDRVSLTYIENQDGGFKKRAVFGVASPLNNFFSVEDFDGDGDLDPLRGTAVSEVAVMFNHGKGSYEAARKFMVGDSLDMNIAAVADFDGDGLPDIAAAGSDRIAIAFNTPAPASPDCNANGIPDECDLASGASQDCDSNQVPDECDVAAGDCNRNGSPDPCDIASGTSPDCDLNGVPDDCDVVDFDCNGNGIPDGCDVLPVLAFSGEEIPQTLGEGSIRAGAGDLDGDGDEDLVAKTAQGEFLSFLSQGDGTFAAPERLPIEGETLAGGDFDNDGRVDLASTRKFPSTLTVLGNRGDGGFVASEQPVTAGRCGHLVQLAAGDVNGDGFLDLAGVEGPCALSAGALILFLGGGDGTFQARDSGRNAAFQSITFADLDSDGQDDIVISRDILFSRGDGFLAFPVPHALTGFSGVPPFPADLDGDRDIDLVQVVGVVAGPGPAARRLGFLLNHGDGTFAPVRLLPIDGGEDLLMAKDFDQDGSSDLITARHGGGPLSVLWNRTRPPASADLDGDRVPDECRLTGRFRRGDCNGDGQVGGEITDAVFLLSFLFLGKEAPPCLAACDANGDGAVHVNDAVFLLAFGFLGGPSPAAPFPGCGPGALPVDREHGCADPPRNCR